ncbi:response regulator [Stenotrophomonas sp. PD6]|uniref:response regulator n=1 Tax=Stenotrophomonas sp. PD6 TaxID=3368612 RepID=UPI003B9FF6A8
MSHPVRRIVLLDDHPIVIEGVESRLAGAEGIEIVGRYTTARDLIHGLSTAALPVDIAIVDFALGPHDVDGVKLLRALRMRFPSVAVLVLSSHFNPATVALALQAGVNGFISKSQGAQDLVEAIACVAAGRLYLHEDMRHELDALNESRPVKGLVTGSTREELTPREHEVLRCILDGMTTTEISAKFSRAMSTISSQKKSAYQKLGIRSDAELFKMRGLIEGR